MTDYELSTVSSNLILDKFADQKAIVSNLWAQSKEKTSLLEGKIELLATYYLQKSPVQVTKKDSLGNDYVVKSVLLSGKEIKALAGRDKSNSFYEELERVAIALKQKINIIRDERTGSFRVISVYGDVSVDNGKMTIEFNPDAEGLFLGLTGNFSEINLKIAFSFSSNGALQLYKALFSYMYKLEPISDEMMKLNQEDFPSYAVSYSLSELRLTLGYVDLTQKDISKEGSKKHPDFDKMDEMDKKPKYRRWVDFNRRVIAPGVEEINETSDVFIKSVETEKSGKGGRVTNITFIIQHNKKFYESELAKVDEDGYVEVVDLENGTSVVEKHHFYTAEQIQDVYDILEGYTISKKEAEALLKEANGNIEKIEKAYNISKEQSYIKQIIPWMRTAIREDYESCKESAVYGDTKKGRAYKEYRENGPSDDVKNAIWDKFKKKDDFEEFLEQSGLELEIIELLDVQERIDLYADFKRNKNM